MKGGNKNNHEQKTEILQKMTIEMEEWRDGVLQVQMHCNVCICDSLLGIKRRSLKTGD